MNSIWCMHECPLTVSQLFDQFQNLFLQKVEKQKSLQQPHLQPHLSAPGGFLIFQAHHNILQQVESR